MNLKKWFRGLFVTVKPADKSSQGAPLRNFSPLVDDSLARKVGAVFSAVKLISEGVAMLPLEYQWLNQSRGCFEPYTDDPLFVALKIAPNSRVTSFDFWRAAVQQILLYGNAYIVPVRNEAGSVVELLLCSPGAVAHDAIAGTYVVNDVVYKLHHTYTADKIIHLRNIGADGGLTGLSTIQAAAKALGISVLADDYVAKSLSDGGLIRGFVSGSGGSGLPTMGVANAKQTADVTDRIERELYEGKQILSMPSDMKFQALALTPGDAKVLENKQMSVHEIARFFRVHPDLLYAGTNNTYKSSEIPNVMFLHQTLAPLLTQIELELLVKLVPRELWSRVRMHFDREAMYLTDLATEVQYIKGTLDAGVYTVNDWRRKKGLPGVVNGDSPLVSANLKTLKEVVQGDSTCAPRS